MRYETTRPGGGGGLYTILGMDHGQLQQKYIRHRKYIRLTAAEKTLLARVNINFATQCAGKLKKNFLLKR